MKHLLFLMVSACLLSAGCVMRAEFTPFVGQQPTWPTAVGGFAKTSSGIPIYTSLPERPYEVIGSGYMVGAQLADMNAAAARMAKKHGGEAALIISKEDRFAGIFHSGQSSSVGNFQVTGNTGSFNTPTTSSGFSGPVSRQHVQIVIIRWKNETVP